mmetsp:Transcript_82786/g.159975  ORF Transcript_82786/g.159975 Transcript_82786/m.159975 type:complete len:140 (-) Transcript_82786:9-428(-)
MAASTVVSGHATRCMGKASSRLPTDAGTTASTRMTKNMGVARLLGLTDVNMRASGGRASSMVMPGTEIPQAKFTKHSGLEEAPYNPRFEEKGVVANMATLILFRPGTICTTDVAGWTNVMLGNPTVIMHVVRRCQKKEK